MIIMPEQRFRISPTTRGAIFKVKRWFYGTFYNKKIPEDVREKNKETWVRFANRLVEEASKRGISDQPARITVTYDIGSRGEFKPISATIEVLEVKTKDKFTIYSDDALENLKSKLENLKKRAEELGVDIDELLKTEE